MAAGYRTETRVVNGVEIEEVLTVKDSGKWDYVRRENGVAVLTKTDVAAGSVVPVLFESP